VPASDSRASRPTGKLAGGMLGLTVGILAGNVLSYGLLLFAARRLVAADYSEVVTLLNLLLIGSVPSFALQAVAARRVAIGSRTGLLTPAAIVGVAVSCVFAAGSVLLVPFLHLPSWTGVLLVAGALPGLALQGLSQGVVQGSQRFGALALTTLIGLVGRSGGGLVGLALARTATGTLTGVTVGILTAAAISLCVTPLAGPSTNSRQELRHLLVEVVHAAHAYGAFLLLTTLDVLLARHVLNADDAAVYAVGSVVTRIALWLPQSVANVLFASLTDPARHRAVVRRVVQFFAGVSLLIVGCAWMLRGSVTAFVGGDRYGALAAHVWMFASLGCALAIIQFTLTAGLALRSTVITRVLWLTVATETIAVLTTADHTSVQRVVGVAASITLFGAAACVLTRLRAKTTDATVPTVF
jgi:hypothetical protein